MTLGMEGNLRTSVQDWLFQPLQESRPTETLHILASHLKICRFYFFCTINKTLYFLPRVQTLYKGI